MAGITIKKLFALAALATLVLGVSLVSAANAAALTTLESLSFVDAHHGWLSGTRDATSAAAICDETLWKTDNGGTTWTRVARTPRLTYNYTSVAFTTALTGLWWNYSGIMRTTDGGTTWQRTGQPASFGEMRFFDSQVGWASGGGEQGGFGAVCKTTDGGRHWRRMLYRHTGQQDGAGFGPVCCPSRLRCYVLGFTVFGGVWSTADGGVHWTRHVLPAIPGRWTGFTDIAFPTGMVGFAVGSRGAVVKTTNGGRTWRRLPSATSVALTAIYFRNTQVGWVVGSGGVILHTTDGGAHWVRQNSGTRHLLTAVTFVDHTHGWIIDYGSSGGLSNSHLLRTSDGGKTWRRVSF